MLIQDALSVGSDLLTKAGIGSPHLDAQLLLAHALGTERTRVLAWPEKSLSSGTLELYLKFLQRRSQREPLAYILGKREFFGRDFRVDQRVLVPRPETELLVDHILLLAQSKASNLRVADVGTGSGAIAVTVALQLPEATVYGLDASADSLALAAENAKHHGVSQRVKFLAGDLLAPLPDTVDIIAANLPYVTTDEWTFLPPELHDYEPRLALDGGPDGLVLIGRLLETAETHLAPQGAILLEIGASQGCAVVTLARESLPQAKVRLVQDLAGMDRLVIVEV